MTIVASIFFVIFAAVQVISYLAIRREWFAPGMVAGIGVVASILSAMLLSVGQGNEPLRALIVGLLMGGILNGITLAAAWFFHMNDLREAASS